MNGKPIDEMSPEELDAELERLRSMRPPASERPKRGNKRLDETPRRRKSLIDLINENS